MSTRFFEVTNSNPSVTAKNIGIFDTDAPVSFLAVLNAIDPLTNDTWNINIINYKGDVLEENINWREIRVEGSVGSLLSILW